MEDTKKDDRHATCYEYGKFGHYKTNCQSLIKHKSKQEFNKTKGKCDKGHKAYISWEEEDEESSSSSSSSSDHDEIVDICLMACHKKKDLEVNDLDSHFKPSYNKMSKEFREIHAYALKAFKKIFL